MLKKRIRLYGVGKRLYLRNLCEKDRAVFDRVSCERRPDVAPYWTEYCEEEWVRAAVQHRARLVCAIVLSACGTVIGFCELKNLDTPFPVIGIWILQKYTGKGYGEESVRMLLCHMVKKKKDIRYFIWIADEDNYPSNQCVKKLGAVLYHRIPANMGPFWELELKIGIIKKEEIHYWNKYGLLPESFTDGKEG